MEELTTNMNALVISPVFVPRVDSEAFCGGKFVQALLDAGIDTSVVCCHTAAFPPFKAAPSSRWGSLRSVTVDVPSTIRAPFGVRAWRLLRYRTTRWTGWTEGVVARARELHATKNFTFVVSRSYPWYAHVAGYWVASILRIPWIANFNDPWDLSLFMADKASRAAWTQGPNEKLWRRRVLAS